MSIPPRRLEEASPTTAIPMVDLRTQYRALQPEIQAALAEVLESSAFIGGEACREFEREFATFCRAGAACGVANGSDALYLALRALAIGPGDEVVTTPFTFVATAEAITRVGARVVFADLDERTLNLDPAAVESALTPRTRAILPVHLYGHPADMPRFQTLAGQAGVELVEDAAQAHGAEVGGRRAGTLGRLACFSFFPSKNLGAYGDGGMLVSDDVDLLAKVRLLANHGSKKKYWHAMEGVSSRLDNLQAAILRVKLKRLEEWNERRRTVAALYHQALAGLPGLTLPEELPGYRAVYHLYTVRLAQRDALAAHLTSRHIASAVHYPRPLHLQQAYEYLGIEEGRFPVAERAAREVLSLPMYPELTPGQVERIAAEVRAFLLGKS
jgi:dTDP-4-amino-4,6-dideoxygalactose transaminase